MAVNGRRIAILGGGKIGESLLSGLLSSGWRKPEEIVVTGRRQERIDELAERYGVETTLSNADAVSGAGFIVIAVKPQDFDVLLGEVGGLLTSEQTVLSVAAAMPTAQIEKHLRDGVPVLRAMPNTPATVHEGVAGLCAGAHANGEHLAMAEEVLTHVGRVVQVPEPYMDAVTAVSGSGPAYFALLAEAMIEAGILLGLSREVSTELVVQTMFGTAKLLRDEQMHPVELREMVTSPGGTTIRAIRELERAGVRAAFLNAIQAAMERSQELRRGRRNLSLDVSRVFDSPREAQSAAADLLVEAARAGGHIALSGGEHPGPAYELAAGLESRLEPGAPSVVGRRALRAARRRALELPARQGDAARPDRAAARRGASHPRRARRRGGRGGVRPRARGRDARPRAAGARRRTATPRRSSRARPPSTSESAAPSPSRTRMSSA